MKGECPMKGELPNAGEQREEREKEGSIPVRPAKGYSTQKVIAIVARKGLLR
jgi:hypothetical protein